MPEDRAGEGTINGEKQEAEVLGFEVDVIVAGQCAHGDKEPCDGRPQGN